MHDPYRLFEQLFKKAKSTERQVPEAMALATATSRGRPSVRMVLLKGVENKAFYFYTNYESRKAHELEQNPWGALLFHWKSLECQVRVEGRIQRAALAESDEYWAIRPRESQVSGLTSRQSRVITSRKQLIESARKVRRRFQDRPIPRPKYWGGYKLIPQSFEFWYSRPNRLHERILFSLGHSNKKWTKTLLQP